MGSSRSRLAVVSVLLLLLLVPTTAQALEARLVELRIVGGAVRANIELRDLFPQKFQEVLESGGAIHLRLQIELWEHRPIWDRLVQPALATVFRIVLDPATRQVSVSDQYGEVSRQPAWQEPLSLRLQVARADAIVDTAHYYLKASAILGTIGERSDPGDAVFGHDDGSVSLGSMGRLLYHAVLQVNDYLQSVSTELKSKVYLGREMGK